MNDSGKHLDENERHYEPIKIEGEKDVIPLMD